MVTLLGSRLEFPPAQHADAHGLVAIGGDLSPARILLAYRRGIFPWPVSEPGVIPWFSPDPRAILELDRLHVPRSLAKLLRQKRFEVTFDAAFADVIHGCAASTPERESTWITSALARAYIRLHQLGHAHSVECWQQGELIGGLYGVSVGGLFAGESMFSRVPNASKVALVHLVDRLRAQGYRLLDVQQPTAHLTILGAITISRTDYLERLKEALKVSCAFHTSSSPESPQSPESTSTKSV